ncbi:MAG: hypothetical protein K2J13_04410, partial [Clostridia bacterium]|nr:hypothetical protein [Clostridia bacterium]
ITVKDDQLSVEKSGATGSAVILLSDPLDSEKIKYQATASFSGSIAKVNLGGVNPRDYRITVLFTDETARGGNFAESIKGSCTVLGHTIVPQENSVTTEYKYYDDTSDVSFYLENVYNKSIVDDTEWIDITIEGKKLEKKEDGSVELSNTFTLDKSKWSIDANHKLKFDVSDVGDYTVKIKPKSGNSWADGSTGEKTYKYTLKYKLKPLAWDKNSSTSITEPYTGEDQYLLLKNYDEDIAKLLTLSPTHDTIPDGQTNAGRLAIKVKDYAKDEKVTVSLNAKYKDYLVWDETNYPTAQNELKYTVSKKKLSATPLVSDWKMEANDEEEKNRTFYLWVDGICKEDDVKDVSFAGYYKKGASGEETDK